VQINPQPLITEVEARYQKEYGEDYLSYELVNEQKFLRLQELAIRDAGFAAIEKSLQARGRPAILDIGCATGALLEHLRERGWAVQGVEICRPSAEYARQVRRLDVRSLPLEENRFPPGVFDLVHASHLIEHLNKPAAFVREVHRILRPQGYFILITPNITGFQARFFKNQWRSAIFDHLYLFSIKTLSKLLTQSGFKIEKIVTWGGIAEGIVPAPFKKVADTVSKRFGLGDVMLVRAVKAR
jgi:2-polyprenyl-3-methyl-5-hydroxy-6-metoxy-1,4-benzoquinol methylase